MRHMILGLVVCWCLTSALALGAQQAQEKATPQRIADLVIQLGSAKFAERDRAMKELEAIGPSALPLLRPGLTSSDTEIRRRVELLVRKFEDQQLASSLLAGKRVRLNVKDATIAEAVAELAKVSGYPVTLSPSQVILRGDSKVSLDTGDTTFWDALQQLCLKADLVDAGSTADVANPKLATSTTLVRAKPPSVGPLQLAAGKAAELPTFVAGSIRVRLLKSTQLPTGEVDLLLQVVAEPRLLGFASSGAPRVDKVIDDQGQSLVSVLIPLGANPAGPAVAGGGIGNAQGIVNANMAFARATVTVVGPNPTAGGFQPFQVTVRLKPGEKSAKKLQEIRGSIPVQCTADAEPVIVVDKILKAAGQTVKGKDDSSLEVLAAEILGNGDVQISVALENISGQKPAGFAGAVAQVRIQQMQLLQKLQIQNNQINGKNAVVDAMAFDLETASPLRLLDAAGDAFALVGLPISSGSALPGKVKKVTEKQTLVFRPKAGQKAAAKLVLPGYRVFAFDVPFTFKDVQLPPRAFDGK